MVMPATASIELKNASYVEESEPGTTPGSPTMLEFWNNKVTLTREAEVLRSGRRLGDGQQKGLRHGRRSVTGSSDCELVYGNHDKMLEYLFGSSFPTAFTEIAAITIAFVASGSQITDSGTGMGDVEVGDWIIVAGAGEAANNGIWYVTAAAAGALTVAAVIGSGALVDEAAGASVTLNQEVRMENGTAITTFTLEGRYFDITQFQVALGMSIDGADFEANSQFTKMALSFLGWDMASPSGSSLGTPTAGTNNEPMDSLITLPQIDGANVRLTNIKMSIKRNRTLSKPLGQKIADEVRKGGIDVTGSLVEYFEGTTTYAKYVAGTKISSSWTCEDPAGNKYVFHVYEALITGAPEGTDDDAITHEFQWEAQRETVTQKTVAVAKYAAP